VTNSSEDYIEASGAGLENGTVARHNEVLNTAVPFEVERSSNAAAETAAQASRRQGHGRGISSQQVYRLWTMALCI